MGIARLAVGTRIVTVGPRYLLAVHVQIVQTAAKRIGDLGGRGAQIKFKSLVAGWVRHTARRQSGKVRDLRQDILLQ